MLQIIRKLETVHVSLSVRSGYVDEDDTNEQETEQITESKSNNFLKSKLQLLSNPTINFQNVIVLKASADDTDDCTAKCDTCTL